MVAPQDSLDLVKAGQYRLAVQRKLSSRGMLLTLQPQNVVGETVAKGDGLIIER